MKRSIHKQLRKVLLLEPNYQNKYPPIGLMKFATYHRIQGWDVVFYKGDLKRFVADRLTLKFVEELSSLVPAYAWGRWYPAFLEYIETGKDDLMTAAVVEFQDSLLPVASLLEAYRQKFRKDEYFSFHEFDRVLVTTLFTFFATETIEAIKFAQRLEPKEIQVGGVMASVVPEYIEEQTGVKPTVGVVDKPFLFNDPPIDTPIDNLPLDYSILEEIEYKYPASDAYFGHTTRGCPNHCQFCVVPILEPEYQSYRPLKEKIAYESRMFGTKSNLLLLDNNVFASKRYAAIVDEIKDVGFASGSKIEETDPLLVCKDRLREKYNERAYLKKGVLLLQGLLTSKRLSEEERTVVADLLRKYDAGDDWHGVTRDGMLCLIDEIIDLWRSAWRASKKSAVVDFNQGLDSRLSVDPAVMKKLSEIPVKPVRIAFDHWELRKTYEKSITSAAKAGFTQMSNYILYNFKDTPEELYWRLRFNIALSDELGISIYSFPMKYHPIQDSAYFSNRHYLGRYWCRKYIRFVQVVLNATMGKVGRGKSFFLKAFGATTDEFRELLLMPEYILLNRLDCEINGEIERWRDALMSLSEEDACVVRGRLLENEINNPELWVGDSRMVRNFLNFYLKRTGDIKRATEAQRQKRIDIFDSNWDGIGVRLSEEELKREYEIAELWPFRIDREQS